MSTSDPQLMNWTFIDDYIVVGEGAVVDSFHYTLGGGTQRAFFKLHFSDAPITDPDNVGDLDIDGDGLSIQVELENNTNPFSALDLNGNGIPDDADTLWATVPQAWINVIEANPQPEFYGVLSGLVLPTGDYDGDGRSNLQEYLVDTDPVDFFNGETPEIIVFLGDGQTAAPQTFLESRLRVLVQAPSEQFYINAPVLFLANNGGPHLSQTPDTALLSSSLLARSDYYGAATDYYTPASIGNTLVTASLPNGDSVTFTIHTVSPASAAKPPIRNFTATENPDGTTSYTWTSDADNGDWFQIESRQDDGSWAPIYQTNYGNSALPFVPGINNYTIILDENNQPVQ